MSSIKGTNVLAPVVPFDTTDTHASHEARYGKGGYRSVADIAERDAIPALRREAGMLVLTLSDGVTWRLASNLTSWTEFKSGASSWDELSGKPSTFAPSSHTHTASQITDFSSAVAAAAPPTTDASLLTSGTLSASRLPASVVLTTDGRLSDARAPLAHQQAISTITGLQAALDAKATPSDVSSAVAAVVNASPASLDTLRELAASLGDDANFAATVTNALAAKAPTASPTFTGTVSGITKGMVGLGSVDNTADAAKPVSTAQAAADSAVASAAASDATAKANTAQAYAIQRANHTGTQAISTVSGLQAALDGKQASGSYAATVHTHGISDVAGLQTSLDGKQASGNYAAASHSHAIADVTGLQTAIDGKAASSHTHALSSLTQSSATTGQVVTWSGSAWAPATPSAGESTLASYAATSNLPATGSASTLYIVSSRLYRWVVGDNVYAEVGTIGGIVGTADGGTYA
jgi:hypothetical protein